MALIYMVKVGQNNTCLLKQKTRTRWIIAFSAYRNITTNYLVIYIDHLEDNKENQN